MFEELETLGLSIPVPGPEPKNFGIAIVALPAGIITAGYMNEIEKLSHDSTKKNG